MAVGATVAAVVAALAIPPWLSATPDVPVVPQPPTPTSAPEVPGSTTWQAIRCPPANRDTCVTPTEIDHGGALFSSVGGDHRQEVVAGSPATERLQVTVPRSRRDRWVLVGADHAGADSRLTVVLGRAAAVGVPPGRLTLFALPGHRRMVISVADRGRPRDGEVLRVQQYAAR